MSQKSSTGEVTYQYIEPRRNSNVPARYVGVINVSTDRMGFCVFSTPKFKLISKHEVPLQTCSPHDGWFEQDPREYLTALNECSLQTFNYLSSIGYSNRDIATLGITNQRETIVLWDRLTGEPLYNAILWKDIRSADVIDEMLDALPKQDKNHFKQICGLPLSPFFSAPKIRWLMKNVPGIRKACSDGRCLAGTLDTWIIWNLTKGALHVTDVTNASRTLLMNIHTQRWDHQLLEAFSIDINLLPEIRSSSEIYGRVYDVTSEFYGMRISGILGNQQASLLGQFCTKLGETKNSFGSACFLLCNTGTKCLMSKHGLVTTIAYQLGPNAPVVYALEGAIAVAGHAFQWLHSQVRILHDLGEVEALASAVANTSGGHVYFVPAFTGLYSPYWRKDARGVICGITDFTTKNHIILAALEAICFQVKDLMECKHIGNVCNFKTLYADGELASNEFLMQLQADLSGITIIRSQEPETQALGVAICAAQADGIGLFEFTPGVEELEKISFDEFTPKMESKERKRRWTKWRRAVEYSLGWASVPKKLDGLILAGKEDGKIPTELLVQKIFHATEEDSAVPRDLEVQTKDDVDSPSAENYNFVNAIPTGIYIALSGMMLLATVMRMVYK